MATKKNEDSAAITHLTYLASALKAPGIIESATRLADHARDAGWTHEEYLAAVLDRDVAARNASGSSCGSEPPGSPPGRRSRSSTGTLNPPSRNRSPRWHREGSSPKRATSSC